MPPQTIFFLGLDRVQYGLHAMIVEGVRLGEVGDAKVVLFARNCALHGEIKPLLIPVGVDIVLQLQIVRTLPHLCGTHEIASFES